MLVNSSGNVRPCCAANGSADNLGHLKEHSLKEIWNSPAMRGLRLDMLAGRKNPKCQLCHSMDSNGLFSMRKEFNDLFKQHQDRVLETRPDGSLPDHLWWTYLEPQFSNICNLRCRMCNPMYSTSWQKDLQYSEFKDGTYEVEHAFNDFDVFWQQLEPSLPQLERLHFSGGEPLLMEGHYQLLEKLIEMGRTDVVLNYHTNLSRLDFKKWKITELWKRFKSVRICISLDASKERFEYIRKGACWEDVRDNIKVLQRECRAVWYEIYPTISIFNVWHLPDVMSDLIEMGLLTYKKFRCKVLMDPDFMSTQVLPPSFKKQVRQRLETFLNRENISLRTDFDYLKNQIDDCIRFMEKEDYSHLLPTLFEKTKELDELRGENLYDVFPELAWLKNYETKPSNLSDDGDGVAFGHL